MTEIKNAKFIGLLPKWLAYCGFALYSLLIINSVLFICSEGYVKLFLFDLCWQTIFAVALLKIQKWKKS
jgi:hypothetical protein